VPPSNPESAIEVFVFADEIEMLFQTSTVAEVIEDTSVTATEFLTRYNVPVSVEVTLLLSITVRICDVPEVVAICGVGPFVSMVMFAKFVALLRVEEP